MENKEIIESQAFKVLNRLIDGKVKQIEGYISMVKDLATMSPGIGFEYRVRIRTAQESISSYGDEQKFPINHDFIDRMKWLLVEIEKQQAMISDLQSFKLNLLNDWDFSRGDDTLQKEIFG